MPEADKQSEKFNRFERLARGLAKVPKKEVDDLEESEAPKTDLADNETQDEEA